jgi:hypothetical protein
MFARNSAPWRWTLRVAAVATVLPLWCAPFLPFPDLPEQVGVIAAMRHLDDPAWRVREHFSIAWLSSQDLYHVLGALLSFVVGNAERANLVLLTLAGLAYPYALRALLRALGRDERLALFGAAAFWSRPLTMGFLPYVASIPVATWGLALIVRQLRRPARARAVGLAFLGVGLFYLHADAYVLFALAAMALAIARRAPWRQGIWIAPSALVASGWALFGAIANRARSLADPGQVGYIPRQALVSEMPEWAHDVWRSHVDEWCAVGLWAAFGVLVLQTRGAAAVRRGGALEPWIPLLCAIAVYFALPYRVGAGIMLNVRLAVFAVLFAAVPLHPRRGPVTAAALAAVAVVSVVGAANAAVEIREARLDELGDFDRLVDRMSQGARVLCLTFRVTSEHAHFAPWTFMGAYHRARGGGTSSASFSELAHWPLRYRPEAAPPPKPTMFWTFDSCLYRNETDGPYYDYVLARGNVDPFRDRPPGPVWRAIDRELDWTLWEKQPGTTAPPWSVPDQGPCESRRSLERLEAATTAP